MKWQNIYDELTEMKKHEQLAIDTNAMIFDDCQYTRQYEDMLDNIPRTEVRTALWQFNYKKDPIYAKLLALLGVTAMLLFFYFVR